ncbi:MAG TPA: hypothetical protein VGP16_03210 [Asanoa sp.]|nr:hypothetical protein [Asanoa sp.]
MDRFESRCWLDWWANSSTLPGCFEVEVVLTAIEAAWTAHGRLLSENEDFEFLCDLDPIFTLRFEDECTVAVTVHPTDGDNGFTLTEYAGPAHRPVEHRIDLKSL